MYGAIKNDKKDRSESKKMLTKNEKDRVVSLAEKGTSYLEIAEEILISRGPKMFMTLSNDVNSYLWKLEEHEEVIKNETK